MMWRSLSRLVLVGSGLVLACPPARADGALDPANQAAALALFKEGRTLMASGSYAEACPKFAYSQKLDPGVGTMLNLAYCYERIGKTASAWSAYGAAASAAHEKAQPEREAIARDRVAALEPTLMHVTISVSRPLSIETLAPEAVDVKLDGTSVPFQFYGVPISIDPGQHEVRATALGRQPWSSLVDADAAHPAVVVNVPVLAVDRVVSLGPPPDVTSAPAPSVADARPLRTASLVAGGAGILALGVGVAFSLAAKAQYDDSQSSGDCEAGKCNPTGQAEQSRAFTDSDVATVSVSIGAAALLGAAILWFAEPRRAAQTRGISVRPTVGKDTWSLNASGVW